jgi:hypothetical protein
MDVSETDLITKAVEEKKAEFLAMITGKILVTLPKFFSHFRVLYSA